MVTLRDERVGETFHPGIGPIREAEALYIDQTSLRSCWNGQGDSEIRVWDVGLGAAANAMAVIRRWEAGCSGDLLLESFDLDTEALEFALKHRKDHAGAFEYLEGLEWESFLEKGEMKKWQGGRRLHWRLHLGDFSVRMKEEGPGVPAVIMYDLYSAPKNPHLYELKLWRELLGRFDGAEGRKSGVVVLHSRSTSLRVTLLLAGWYVGRGTALGEKEETTLAATHPDLLENRLDEVWLGKVSRSTSAEPWVDGAATGPISKRWWEELRRHPQWGCGAPGIQEGI
ncbi:MAG: hypothetical protein HC904_07075 [Blastochloris sp.]|nr:hypothetical protein [Blastochloris sp.]